MRIVRLGPRCRRHRAIRPRCAGANPGGAYRLRRTDAYPRRAQGAHGGDLGHPRRDQSRGVLRDGGRGAGRGGAGRGSRSDHRRPRRQSCHSAVLSANWIPAARLSSSSTSAADPPKWCWASRDVEASFSADIGCVRLTERCLHSDPPTAAEVAAARDVVRDGLGEALRAVPVERARTWVGVAGTMTTLSALAQKMADLRPGRRSTCRGWASATCSKCATG